MNGKTLEEVPSGSSVEPLASSKSKIYFNAIDKAHEILEYQKDLADKVPSCVVVGMQSVGKSAILSRISGVRFPQDSEVCTRVPIELRLRRATAEDQDASKPIIIKAGNFEGEEVDKTDDDAVENALREAQKKLLNNRQFELKLSVKIEKENVDLPEVTLIDLPGIFFAKDERADHLEKKVKSMINDRVNNEMALILHVVPLDQDTDTISTWRTVRDADVKQERTISVLTKADLVLQDRNGREKLKKRLKRILTDSKYSKCFVVHGAATTLEEEELQLSEVSNYITEFGLEEQIKVGVKELNEFIEERMLEHVREKIPEMRSLLEDELSRSKAELKMLGRKPLPAFSIAQRDLQSMIQYLVDAFGAFQPEFRRFTERMSRKIFDIEMKPLGLIDVQKANKALKRNSMFVGNQDIFEIDLTNPTSNASNKNTLETYQEDHILALEAKVIAEKSRAMINAPYVGSQKALEKWLETFVEPLDRVLKEYVDEIFEVFYQIVFSSSIQKGSSDLTNSVIRYLEWQVNTNVITRAKKNAKVYAGDLVDSVKENTFTSDDHYLLDKVKELETTVKSGFLKSLNESYRHKIQMHCFDVCRVRAFFEARKKILPDTIQLHFTKVVNDLLKATKTEIQETLLSDDMVSKIKESNQSNAERMIHLEREQKIEKALEQISLL